MFESQLVLVRVEVASLSYGFILAEVALNVNRNSLFLRDSYLGTSIFIMPILVNSLLTNKAILFCTTNKLNAFK